MGDIEFQHLIEFTGSDELGDDEDAPVGPALEPYSRRRPSSRTSRCPKPESPAAGTTARSARRSGTGLNWPRKRDDPDRGPVLELDKQGVYDGAIATVGNAPTAAFALADCIEDGTRPAAIVATPSASSRQKRVASASAKSAKNTMCRRSPTSAAAAAADWRRR